MKKLLIFSLLCICLATAGCVREKFAESYTTTADKSLLFAENKLTISAETGKSSENTLVIDESRTFQTVDGFGAAMTWASCHNLMQMKARERHDFLKELFDTREGLGISLIRVSIGASDFNYDEYTWCDTPGIENFAMHESDKQDLIPVLKEVYAINPAVKIIASPWSCPRWMKCVSTEDDSDFYSWTSGSLKRECYADYASYFVKWIRAMEAEGFDIHAVTIQNEPLNHGNSMSLYMTWEEQRDFIKTALGPAFRENGIKAKILLFDHNYNYDNEASQRGYPLNIYKDPEASAYTAGSAWHNYGGSVRELDNILAAAPDKEIYFTEASIGTWNYEFGKCLLGDFDSIFLQTLERSCKGVTLWNMVLDENRGPFSPKKGSCKTCFGVATMQSGTAVIIDRTSHYYDIAHASKVVHPGAVRTGVEGPLPDEISCQAFRNVDGSFGILILNKGEQERILTIRRGNEAVDCPVPEKAIVSVLMP